MMVTMKVLIDARSMQTPSRYRGIGRYTSHLIRAFADRNDIHFLHFGSHPPRSWPLVNTVGLNAPHRLITLTDRFTLPRLLQRHSFSTFHSVAFALPRSSGRNKQVITIHDLTPLRFPSACSARHRLVFSKIIASARRADCILADSGHTAGDLEFFFPEMRDRIRIVYNAVTDDIDPGKVSKPAWALPERYLFYCGGADRIKNLETLVDAIPSLSLPLIVSGFVSRKRQVQLLKRLPVNERNKLIFCGYQANQVLAWLYLHAELFLFPSLNEGFGYPPLEALRCGCPVLVSRLSALPEILGKAAHYVDSATDPQAWAERITELTGCRSARSMDREMSSKIPNLYTIDRFREKIQDVYASLE